MTIRIIRRGVPPSEKIYKVTCARCDSLLAYKMEDIEVTDDYREHKSFQSLNCPVCANKIFITQHVEANELLKEEINRRRNIDGY